MIQSIKFENTASTYSLTTKLEYDHKNHDEKTMLYKMLYNVNCNGCSTAPLTQYKNNPIYQDITPEEEYRDNSRDDRIYIDMRRSQGYTDELEKLTRDDSGLAVVVNLKDAAQKEMRLRITGFYQSEYWYAFSNKGYIMTYKNYNISKEDQLQICKSKVSIKKYINVPKWEEEDTLVEEEEEKAEEAYHTFIKIKFILGRDLKQLKELFQKF